MLRYFKEMITQPIALPISGWLCGYFAFVPWNMTSYRFVPWNMASYRFVPWIRTSHKTNGKYPTGKASNQPAPQLLHSVKCSFLNNTTPYLTGYIHHERQCLTQRVISIITHIEKTQQIMYTESIAFL